MITGDLYHLSDFNSLSLRVDRFKPAMFLSFAPTGLKRAFVPDPRVKTLCYHVDRPSGTDGGSLFALTMG